MDTLGARLKRLRENKKISLRKLGGMAHLSHSFIADIESGRSNPSIDTLNALAKALDVVIRFASQKFDQPSIFCRIKPLNGISSIKPTKIPPIQ